MKTKTIKFLVQKIEIYLNGFELKLCLICNYEQNQLFSHFLFDFFQRKLALYIIVRFSVVLIIQSLNICNLTFHSL